MRIISNFVAVFVAVVGSSLFLVEAENVNASSNEVAASVVSQTNNAVSDLEIQVDFINFEKKQIEALSRTKPLDMTTLLGLYAAGSGDLLAAPVVRARSGEAALVKGVVEYIYPTTFSDLTVSNNPYRFEVTETTVVPQDFATREVGVIVEVTPERSPDRQNVALVINTRMVFPAIWRDYGKMSSGSNDVQRSVRMEQPFFPVFSSECRITMNNNSTALLSGGASTADPTKMLYLFVHVRTLDSEGNQSMAISGQ